MAEQDTTTKTPPREIRRGDVRLVRWHDKRLDRWIAKHHYLGYTPPGAILRFWVLEGKRIVGAMMFGRPSSRMLDQYRILELTRMYFVDDTKPFIESQALSMARSYIRRYLPHVKGLIAYSSPAYGHEGTVYLADGWFCVGRTQGGTWSNRTRIRRDVDPTPKLRWVRTP